MSDINDKLKLLFILFLNSNIPSSHHNALNLRTQFRLILHYTNVASWRHHQLVYLNIIQRLGHGAWINEVAWIMCETRVEIYKWMSIHTSQTQNIFICRWCVACGCRRVAEFIKILRRITIAGTIKMGNKKSKWNEVMKKYFIRRRRTIKGRKFSLWNHFQLSTLRGKRGSEWDGNIGMLKLFILYTYLQFPAFFYTS